MPTKVFTTISGPCPFGKNVTIDSPGCRSCEHFYRTGTGMFFWCNHPVPEKKKSVPKKPKSVPKKPKSVPKTAKSVPKSEKAGTQGRKRGRPPKNGPKSPVKTTKPKKR